MIINEIWAAKFSKFGFLNIYIWFWVVISELNKHMYTSRNRQGKEKADTLQEKKKELNAYFQSMKFCLTALLKPQLTADKKKICGFLSLFLTNLI